MSSVATATDTFEKPEPSGLTVYNGVAWYYASWSVNRQVVAEDPAQALQRLQLLADDEANFWEGQRDDIDSAGGTTYEIHSVDPKESKVLAIDAAEELAPDGATDLLRELLDEIVEFDTECRRTEYTDTDVVWCIFDRYQERIRDVLGKDVATAEATSST